MKKAPVIFLLLLFAFNAIGVHWLFVLERSAARAEMERTMREKSKETLAIPLADLEPSKGLFTRIHAREVRYKGKLFDVVYESRSATHLILKGHYDKKEDKAYARLKNSTQDDQPVKGKRSFRFHFDYLPIGSVFLFSGETKDTDTIAFEEPHPHSHIPSIPTPPPEAA